MKIIVECESKELANLILNLSQPLINADTIISTVTDKMKDTIDSISHTLQE